MIHGSVVSLANLRFLELCARAASTLPGSLAELGVYRGGSARVITDACPNRTLHLFDTFTGIPGEVARPDVDAHVPGDFADVELAAVRERLAGRKVEFHVGLFPLTASAVADETFSLVHIDADLYASVRAGLEFFWPRLVVGGVVVLDDYGCPKCRGCDLAADEWAEREGAVWRKVAEHGVYILKQ